MKDIEKDGQRFVFEGQFPGAKGTVLRFSGECAVCRKPISFDAKSFGRAAATPLRRCPRHKVPGAAVGSKAEAIAIATHGWRVVSGSLVDTMRKSGRAWEATVTFKPPSGVVAARKPTEIKVTLLGNAYLMVHRIAAHGPCSSVAAAEGSDMSHEYAYVLAGRLVEKGMLRRVTHGRYEVTDKGREVVFAPGLLSTVGLSCRRDEPVTGLFD